MAKYFSDKEFECKHCHTLPENGMDKKLLEVLDAAREDARSPIYVTSGYRCPAHNCAVGGAPASQHMLGKAADVYSEDLDVFALKAIIKAAMIRAGVEGGLQEYADQGFVHVDTRGYWAEWC